MIEKIINLFRKMGKLFLWIVWVLIFAIIALLLYYKASDYLRPKILGSKDLGSNIYMIKGEHGSNRIVLGTEVRINACLAGIDLLCASESSVESVVGAKSDDRWIIVKMYNDSIDQSQYYIIDKYQFEAVRKTAIFDNYESIFTCFPDSMDFANECQVRGIDLTWQK